MKKYLDKYKEVMPFIVVSSIIGSAVASCILLAVVGKKED